MYTLQCSQKMLVNTDPQRRCYNGAHYSSEWIDLPWEDLDSSDTLAGIEKRLKFWIELNDYAVSQRSEGARKKFRVLQGENVNRVYSKSS